MHCRMRFRFDPSARCWSGLGSPPTAWFLPGPKRMRGGAARRFANDRHFHRGSQAESTCRAILEKLTHYQRLAESRAWRAGFFVESRESTLRKPPCRKPASGSHLQGSCCPSRDCGFSCNLCAALIGHWRRARHTTFFAQRLLRRVHPVVNMRIVNLACCDLGYQHGQPYGIGWPLFFVGSFGHGVLRMLHGKHTRCAGRLRHPVNPVRFQIEALP